LGYYFIDQVDDLIEHSEILNSYPNSFLANTGASAIISDTNGSNLIINSDDETADANESININSIDETTDAKELMNISVIRQTYPNWG